MKLEKDGLAVVIESDYGNEGRIVRLIQFDKDEWLGRSEGSPLNWMRGPEPELWFLPSRLRPVSGLRDEDATDIGNSIGSEPEIALAAENMKKESA